jgi:hypothetical protein
MEKVILAEYQREVAKEAADGPRATGTHDV